MNITLSKNLSNTTQVIFLKDKQKDLDPCTARFQNGNIKYLFDNNPSAEDIRVAFSKILNEAKRNKIEKVEVDLRVIKDLSLEELINAAYEGLILTDYSFDKYLTKKKNQNVDFTFIVDDLTLSNKALKESEDLTYGVILARNLVNEPPNILNPIQLAKEARSEAEKAGFEIKVFGQKEIEALKMGAFLAVARGSVNEPQLIVMRYCGDKNKPLTALVGKGITFDTGGNSLKSREAMITMKSDMAGAAAVIGAFSSIARQKLAVNIVGIIAACENMASGDAYRPDDIVTSMAGTTIEVLNTDAEGRLTLADAVHYAIENEKAEKIIDLATLTGACIVALGNITTGVLSNDDKFLAELQEAAKKSNEEVWRLPNRKEYRELIKSDIADIKNLTDSAGMIGAGIFIEEFVQKKPWIHMDIAGTSFSKSEKNYIKKGGTGVSVRTLFYMMKNSVKNSK